MGREALSTEVWLQGTCSDVQLHRLSYLRPRRARAGGIGGQRELSTYMSWKSLVEIKIFGGFSC